MTGGQNITAVNISNSADVTLAIPTQDPYWIISTTISIICLLITSWLFAGLMFYGIRNHKMKLFNTADKSGGLIYCVAVLSAAFGIAFHAMALFCNQFGYSEETLRICAIGVRLAVELLTVSMSWVYIFLWLKQRALYNCQAFSSLNTIWVKLTSWFSIILMLLGLHSGSLVYNIKGKFVSTVHGCVNNGANWPALYCTFINGTGQFTLLGLFVYPVIRKIGMPHRGRGQRMFDLLKRVCACTLVCITTDSIVGGWVGLSGRSDKIALACYEVNLMFNTIAVVLTFETWKDIVRSPLVKATGHQMKRNATLTSYSRTAGSFSQGKNANNQTMYTDVGC